MSRNLGRRDLGRWDLGWRRPHLVRARVGADCSSASLGTLILEGRAFVVQVPGRGGRYHAYRLERDGDTSGAVGPAARELLGRRRRRRRSFLRHARPRAGGEWQAPCAGIGGARAWQLQPPQAPLEKGAGQESTATAAIAVGRPGRRLRHSAGLALSIVPALIRRHEAEQALTALRARLLNFWHGEGRVSTFDLYIFDLLYIRPPRTVIRWHGLIL